VYILKETENNVNLFAIGFIFYFLFFISILDSIKIFYPSDGVEDGNAASRFLANLVIILMMTNALVGRS